MSGSDGLDVAYMRELVPCQRKWIRRTPPKNPGQTDRAAEHILRAVCWLAGTLQQHAPADQAIYGLLLFRSKDSLQETCRRHDQDLKMPSAAKDPSDWSWLVFARYYTLWVSK